MVRHPGTWILWLDGGFHLGNLDLHGAFGGGEVEANQRVRGGHEHGRHNLD